MLESPTTFQAPGEVGFSADGTRWTAIGALAGAEKGKYGEVTLLVDGEVAARVDEMGLPAMSDDGRHVAYLARTEDGVRIMVDGTKGRSFPTPEAPCGAAALQAAAPPDLALRHSVRFLADGGILVVTRDAEGWGVYRDGLRIASYAVSSLDQKDDDCAHLSEIAPATVRTASEAPAAFWWERVAGDAEIWRVVRNGHPVDDVTCVEPWRRHPPEPSADGTTVVYPCLVQKPDSTREIWLIHGKEKYGPYGDVWGMAPTKNGAHVAYGAAEGTSERNWSIHVDGTRRVSGFSAVWRPRLSEDAKHLAWQGVRDPLERSVFGIDDRPLGSFDGVLWGPEFEPDDRVTWVIRRGRKLTRVTVPVELAAEKPDGASR